MFYEWLNNLVNDDTLEGDFARDALRDPHFPKLINDRNDLDDYMSSKGEPAYEAAMSAFDLYEKDTHHQS